jgi:tRNA-splicing ligase RtcB
MHPNISAIFGTHDENTLKQLEDVASRAVKVSLQADGHMGYVMPIGGVAAYRNQVSVVGVGFDIACGNAAIRTNLTLQELIGMSPREAAESPHTVSTHPTLQLLADDIQRNISFGIGRKNHCNDAPVDHPLFESGAWSLIPGKHEQDTLRKKARDQLGTCGSGNHYVDCFYDELGQIWIGVHFGSRGLGHTIASGFLSLAEGKKWGERVPEKEALLDLATPLGHDYWHLMELCGQYAYAGREWVARKVVELLGAKEEELVHNHHNFAWKETHTVAGQDFPPSEEELVVVRKGATPAFPGQLGFVGGSMGDNSVILQGRDSPKLDYPEWRRLQQASMYSTVHGAGRVMSRTEAAGKRDRKTGLLKVDKATGEPIKPGKVTPEMMTKWLETRGVILRGGGLDESPHVYRRLPDVLDAQQGTIEVLHTLTPLVVVMAGADEVDPYKD